MCSKKECKGYKNAFELNTSKWFEIIYTQFYGDQSKHFYFFEFAFVISW